MELAIVITIKNERDLIRNNIFYHHKMGVGHFFVYLDGTEDDSAETIKDLEYVFINETVKPYLFAGQPELELLVKNHSEQVTARQNLNTIHALHEARTMGVDWLIALDADELLCVDLEKGYAGQLISFFDSIPSQTETVRFTTLEVVSRQINYQNVFLEETLFKRPGMKINHSIYDPFRKRKHIIQGFYGHRQGKSAVRTKIDCIPKTPHKFTDPLGNPLATEWRGYLLHYYCYDFNDFIKKFKNFQNRPDTYLLGNPLVFQKRLWRDLVNHPEVSTGELESYFFQWIMSHPSEIKKLSRKHFLGVFPLKPKIIKVKSVKELLI